MPGSAITAVAEALAGSDMDLPRLGLAWARAMPAVTIVPAFGLRALPVPARAVMALAFAASIFPALPTVLSGPSGGSEPWMVLALGEAARGLPVAVAAAVPLWAATMAGGVADALRGSRDAPNVPTVEGTATPLGVPLSLLASAFFLSAGGPARVALALAAHRPSGGSGSALLSAAGDVIGGIGLAVALGGPLLAAALVLEIAAALVARAATPAQVHALLAPLRALGVLAVMAIVFDRVAAALAIGVAAAP